MQVTVLVEPLDPVDELQPAFGPLGHRHRDRSVQLHDRRRSDRGQPAVERLDLRPVRLLLEVQRRDRGLQLVRARPPTSHCAIEHPATLLDPSAVPQRAVLVLEEHERAVCVDPSLPPRVVQQHQREQPVRFRLVRHQHREDLPEPDRLLAELAARRRPVALVEDQVDDGQNRPQPLRQQVVRRDAERDAGVTDLPLRTNEPLGHGRLRDEEGARNLLGGQAAERPKRQRDLRLGCERRMAAREDQAQLLVGNHLGLLVVVPRRQSREELGLPLEGPLAPDPVDRAVASRGRQPGAGVVRHTVDGPALQRGRHRVLKGVLGEVEVAEDADQAREHAPPLGAEDALELAQCSTTGRTSIAPPFRAAGIFEANSIASSMFAHSTR